MTYYLITGIGGDIAQGICRIIRAYDQSSILIGTDISKRHAGSLFVDHFKVIPNVILLPLHLALLHHARSRLFVFRVYKLSVDAARDAAPL